MLILYIAWICTIIRNPTVALDCQGSRLNFTQWKLLWVMNKVFNDFSDEVIVFAHLFSRKKNNSFWGSIEWQKLQIMDALSYMPHFYLNFPSLVIINEIFRRRGRTEDQNHCIELRFWKQRSNKSSTLNETFNVCSIRYSWYIWFILFYFRKEDSMIKRRSEYH